jgi:hypothetical protein
MQRQAISFACACLYIVRYIPPQFICSFERLTETHRHISQLKLHQDRIGADDKQYQHGAMEPTRVPTCIRSARFHFVRRPAFAHRILGPNVFAIGSGCSSFFQSPEQTAFFCRISLCPS